MSSAREPLVSEALLAGERVALAGKLGGATKREANQLIRKHGGVPVDLGDEGLTVLVVGVGQLLQDEGQILDEATRAAADAGRLRIMSEPEFWDWLHGGNEGAATAKLYTPAMLAELVGVPLATIRRWQRRGLIVPVREVHRLPYFDFEEVAAARQLANLLAAGVSPAALEKKLAALGRFVKGVDRSIRQLGVIVEGRQVLLRQEEGLVEPSGQRRFDFEAFDSAAAELPPEPTATIGFADALAQQASPQSPAELLLAACAYEENEQLGPAVDMCRAAMAAGGPTAEACFQLAELLYRMGDVSAARERYFMAVELDENFVEARATLGCVLVETGELELAVAAFEGALAHHPDYADVHYHLARSLGELNRPDEARREWQMFLQLAPDSPWAEEARRWLSFPPENTHPPSGSAHED